MGATRDHEHLQALDGLRAISIGLVLLTHLLPLGPKTLRRLNEMTGPMGMSLFFALSGFLIMRTLQADSVAAFAVKRLARIVPLVWLYLAVVTTQTAASPRTSRLHRKCSRLAYDRQCQAPNPPPRSHMTSPELRVRL